MTYKDFNNIKIEDFFGVSRVAQDTLILAKQASLQPGKKVLEIGIGSGFIAIYLKSISKEVEGVDISEESVIAASKNAQKNKLDIKFYQSDLFENVKDKFDLIVFNPPIGMPSSKKFASLIEKIKYLFPRNTFLFKFFMIFSGGYREALLKRFLEKAKDHLNKNGKIIFFMTDNEKKILSNFSAYSTIVFKVQGKNVVVLTKI